MAGKKTILVIDDDPDIRFFCTTVLQGAGYTVHTADSGESGLAMAAEVKPDLVVLDIIMERIDTGYSVAKKLGGAYPVILFSSITNESDQVFDSADLPVNAVLSKPIDSRKFIEKVKEILGM